MKLEPTEAQRKAMAEKLLSGTPRWAPPIFTDESALKAVDEMFAAANSIPEGPPVDTIALHPSGKWIAHRATPDRWEYTPFRGAAALEAGDDADSWPVIYDPRVQGTSLTEGLTQFSRGEGVLSDWLFDADPTAQQEPGESLSRGLDDLAAGRVSRRDDYLEPQQEPATTHPVSPESTNCVPKPRTPRVVDRLGVDEQGSRWRNCAGLEFWHDGTRWVSGGLGDDLYGDAYEPDALPPYTEKLEPRVLPSLDCEEARDGTAWQAAFSQTDHSRGWKFWYVPAEREWHTDAGHDGSSPLRTLDFLTERGPYTEVLGDPS